MLPGSTRVASSDRVAVLEVFRLCILLQAEREPCQPQLASGDARRNQSATSMDDESDRVLVFQKFRPLLTDAYLVNKTGNI